jgi:hypothetical protein
MRTSTAGQGEAVPGLAGQGLAWRGLARQGQARLGAAGQGTARRGTVTNEFRLHNRRERGGACENRAVAQSIYEEGRFTGW